jgi:hypothetical protein
VSTRLSHASPGQVTVGAENYFEFIVKSYAVAVCIYQTQLRGIRVHCTRHNLVNCLRKMALHRDRAYKIYWRSALGKFSAMDRFLS